MKQFGLCGFLAAALALPVPSAAQPTPMLPTPPPTAPPTAAPARTMPMPAATGTPVAAGNEARVGCVSASPDAIGGMTIVLIEKRGSHDFGNLFEKVQQDVHRVTGFFNTNVTRDEIKIDLKGPVLSTLIPHAPEYFMSAIGSIHYLAASGCGREFAGFTPDIDEARVGVTTALTGTNPAPRTRSDRLFSTPCERR